MGKPKKRTSPRRTGMRRSHHLLKLARRVNGLSPVRATVGTKKIGKKAAK